MELSKKEMEQKRNTNLPLQETSPGEKRRIDYNRELLGLLGELIELFPHQRFGQIICNYVFPEYREKDPFFEESKGTYNRLKLLKGWKE